MDMTSAADTSQRGHDNVRAPGALSTSLSRRDQWHAVTAGYLGWTLDAFDFFVLVFLVDVLAAQFHVTKGAIIWTLTATLATRPLGALLFGLLADRYGRRGPLMANVIFFSVVELLCGFAPNYQVFLILRLLYGIGMGGEWGVGASLAMESAPKRLRGLLSGALQSGYSMGYLLAAVAARVVLPTLGWRAMFWVGGLPALLAFYIRFNVKESEAWKRHRVSTMGAVVRTATSHWKLFVYLVLMMTFMVCLSHGTQDLYPDFLKSARGASASTVSYIAILYNVGAIIGAILFGHISQVFGRRRGITAALALTLAMIPVWAFANGIAVLAVGAFLLQAGVQGAWGIIPAHINELSPGSVRGLVPGFSYQLGILLASGTGTIEYALQGRFGYSWALAGFELGTVAMLMLIVNLGSEQHGADFGHESSLGGVTAANASN
jgi:MFS transporter, SHS family, lactate transporter